jgi:hypothetical protein
MLCVLLDAELTPGTQFNSFTVTKVQILTLQAPAAAARACSFFTLIFFLRFFYFLFFFRLHLPRESFAVSNSLQILPQFPCFISTKVHVLTCFSPQLLLASP